MRHGYNSEKLQSVAGSDGRNPMKIYFDTSALNRPFDDLSQPRVALEALAVESILLLIETNVLLLVSSDVLAYEVSRHPYPESQWIIQSILKLAVAYQPIVPSVLERGQELENSDRIGNIDALHLACAELQGVDYSITCDDRLVKRYRGRLKALNPTAFVLAMTQPEDL
jgi:predicted nucleic acid-binding protein